MKKYLPGILAIIVAFCLTSFRKSATELMVEVSMLTTANVSLISSYADDHVHECPGVNGSPCALDLTQISSSYNVTDRVTFVAYLNSTFATSALRVQEVNRIAVEWYD